MQENEPPGIEEKYSSAVHASNLRVEADRGSPADILIAAAWSPSRLGGALLRLHSEWDSAAKPRRVSQDAITGFARTIAGKTEAEKRAKAQKIADDWYLHEAGMLFGRLKTMPQVREQVIIKLEIWNIESARHIGPAILLHWIDPVCRPCDGLKFVKILGAPSLSIKACRHCQGSGKAPMPFPEIGRRMENYMDECVNTARTQIKARLRNTMKSG